MDERERTNVRRLLLQVADKAKCKGCGQEIFWVRTRAGKLAPYTTEAINHFADCPVADRFRK